MGFGPFSSESTSEQSSSAINQQQAASDQAVNFSQRHAGNTKTVNKVARNGTLVINNGLSAEQLSVLTDQLSARAAHLAGVDTAVQQRIDTNLSAGSDATTAAVAASNPKQLAGWIAAGVGLVAVIALFALKGRPA